MDGLGIAMFGTLDDECHSCNQVAKVAIACQFRLDGLSTNHAT